MLWSMLGEVSVKKHGNQAYTDTVDMSVSPSLIDSDTLNPCAARLKSPLRGTSGWYHYLSIFTFILWRWIYRLKTVSELVPTCTAHGLTVYLLLLKDGPGRQLANQDTGCLMLQIDNLWRIYCYFQPKESISFSRNFDQKKKSINLELDQKFDPKPGNS